MLYLTQPFRVTREELRHVVRAHKYGDRWAADGFPLERLLAHALADTGPLARLAPPPAVDKEGYAWTAQWRLDKGTAKVWVSAQKPPSPWMKSVPRGHASIALDGMAQSIIYQFEVEE